MRRDHPAIVASKIMYVVFVGPQMLYRSYVELSDGVNTILDYACIAFLTHIIYVLIVYWLERTSTD